MKLLIIFVCFVIAVHAHPSDKASKKEKSSKHANVSDHLKQEKLKGAESMYHNLPMPFVHYPFPFVNSYTPRYFPYGYAGVGHGYGGLGYGFGGLGYGFGYGHYY